MKETTAALLGKHLISARESVNKFLFYLRNNFWSAVLIECKIYSIQIAVAKKKGMGNFSQVERKYRVVGIARSTYMYISKLLAYNMWNNRLTCHSLT